jgi:hypothetical protein
MIKLAVFSVTENGQVYAFDWKELGKMQTTWYIEEEDHQEIVGRKA